MTISKRVQKELYSAAPAGVLPPLAVVAAQQQAQAPKSAGRKRGARTYAAAAALPKKSKGERALAAAAALENKGKAWTDDEHARFLEALKTFPSGPWKAIADFVGTKNSRQTMTHAQKYRQKHERRVRGLRNRAKHRKASRAASAPPPLSPEPQPQPQPAFTSRLIATTRSQSKRRASAIAHEPLVIPSTPQAAAACVGVSDSPRSGEESTASVGGAGVAFLEPVAVDVLMERADAFASSYEDAADWEQLKVSSLSEIFQDFEPMNFLPTMWSTSSLGDIEALGGAAAPALAFSGANELFSDSSAAAANPLSLWG